MPPPDLKYARSSRPPRPPLRARLALETFEDRTTPTNFVVNSVGDLPAKDRTDPAEDGWTGNFLPDGVTREVTLRSAIETANALPATAQQPHKISFSALVSAQNQTSASVILTSPLEDIRKSIEFDGVSRDLLTITRDTSKLGFPYFSVATLPQSPSCLVKFANMTIRDAVATFPNFGKDSGAAIRSAMGLVLDSMAFINNESIHGGAIFSSNTLWATNCRFESNKATGEGSDGGAIDIIADSATIRNSQFVQNEARAGKGGAIAFNNISQLTLSDTDFVANVGDQGGAIYSSVAGGPVKLKITRGKFLCNSASNGGALLLSTVTTEITGAEFDGNYADKGGAIYSKSNDLTLSNTTFGYNMATLGPQIAYNGVLNQSVWIDLNNTPGLTAADLIRDPG
ncbi:MAG: hypothetical protein K2V38_01330 [Gemmataceae bacterium]|nr:hypothetical protein [Gemmataceae bacterium]